ncbi:MAG: hypothetical protein M0Q13_02465, partial [Methanothrix sp.]|nr:hypothetical protein [Methanothrix sp.]
IRIIMENDYNINNSDILINNNGQIFQVIHRKDIIENYFIRAITLINNEVKEVILLKDSLNSFRNITNELKLLFSYYKEYFDNNFIELDMNSKKIKLDLSLALKKIEELKKDFNVIRNKELEN